MTPTKDTEKHEAGGLPFRLWWMNDNHTFVKLRNDNLEDTLAHVRECWERSPGGMLCGYQPAPNDDHLPGQVHGCGRDNREAFEAEARIWLAQFLPNEKEKTMTTTKDTQEHRCQQRLVRSDLVWHPGPAIGGGGTAQDESPSPDIPWWKDGDLLLVIVNRNDGPEVSCVRVHADGDGLDFANAATDDFDFGWADRDISWWAPLDNILPTESATGEPTLFDMNSVLMDSPRLKEIKEHDIQTHYSPHMEEFPWLAIPMNAARAMLKGSGLTENESRSVAEIMAGYCRLLDDAGMTFLGETEHDVQEDALAWCRQNERDEI